MVEKRRIEEATDLTKKCRTVYNQVIEKLCGLESSRRLWTFLLASTLGFMILDSGVNNTGASGAKRLLVDANKFMTAIITVVVFMWKTFLLASTLGFMILDSGVNNTGASGAKRLLVDANKFMTAIITVVVFMWKTFLLASTLGFMILDSGVNNTGASGAKRLLVDANKVRTVQSL
ncbi:hypothetical protein Bca52824_072970 [Brassica carinata]|uniref:Uncharacterized protein n=1 Tax=Brassica carinata TaxID=52824 RepID=A0A8X7U687_BRACI|nr:hypothetical protein Bca52824_072970 [Brassica carinata]